MYNPSLGTIVLKPMYCQATYISKSKLKKLEKLVHFKNVAAYSAEIIKAFYLVYLV